ncbi:uncharacterized protein LOC132204675 [Neocloeon triangulifer]|uniref:uncharacterized protein LOC132204675 n=1 Tax=Neocloeon triangulifer TaxID=2078957 RepID=UPI00286EC98D|nr:uncharacterized protein LOC132204675 [Neocloeon triangulifer]
MRLLCILVTGLWLVKQSHCSLAEEKNSLNQLEDTTAATKDALLKEVLRSLKNKLDIQGHGKQHLEMWLLSRIGELQKKGKDDEIAETLKTYLDVNKRTANTAALEKWKKATFSETKDDPSLEAEKPNPQNLFFNHQQKLQNKDKQKTPVTVRRSETQNFPGNNLKSGTLAKREKAINVEAKLMNHHMMNLVSVRSAEVSKKLKARKRNERAGGFWANGHKTSYKQK